jgi:GT2 family glycosyltransferase
MASVDVVIPNYQYGRYLRGCVESVLDQGLPDVRVLIIDNASTDDSVEVARQIAHEDRRVELVARRRNLGSHASFNAGIDWASADYFMVLCADDLVAPGALARSVALMESRPEVGMAYGRFHQFGDDDPVPARFPGSAEAPWRVRPGGAALKQLCRTTVFPMSCCTTLVRTAVQKRAGYYRSSLSHTDDYELWMRIALLGHVASTDAVHGLMRIHGSALSSFLYGDCVAYLGLCGAAFDSFFAHEGASLPAGRRLRRTAGRGVAARAYWSAVSRLLRGKRDASLELARFALRHRPSMAVVPPLDHLLWRDGTFGRVGGALSRLGRRARLAASGLAPRAGRRA